MIDMNTTYEELLDEKLSQIDSSLDKREGSMIFNATAANTAETVQMLLTLAGFVDMVFADTAPREYLIRRAAERGVIPEEATKAVVKGEFNIDVAIGERFSLDAVNYIVTEKISPGIFKLQCESFGEAGNLLGTLIPINYITGLSRAEVTEILIPGEDEEDTEIFRQRYFNSFESTAFGGNRADYKSKVGALDGVGGVRVYRAWNGGGTVKLVIINASYQVPSQVLIDTVQQEVDPLDAQGEGVGIAPLDHVVTVVGVGEIVINIATNITYQSGFKWADVQQDVYAMIDDYFKSLAKEWATAQSKADDEAGVVVRISQIETRLLSVIGILDIANTTLNGAAANIQLDATAIPKRGVVSG